MPDPLADPLPDPSPVGVRRIWLAVAGVGGLAAVAAGAVAAHHAGDARGAELLRTGALYGMVHAAALVALAAAMRPGNCAASVAGWAFSAGIVLFSGSLFALALSGVADFGRVTPFGGVAFMIGWAAVAIAALRR